MKAVLIEPQSSEDPDLMMFHTNERVSSVGYQNFDVPVSETGNTNLSKVGPIAAECVKNIAKVNGTIYIEAFLHGFLVRKASRFTWSEGLMKEVAEAIKHGLGGKGEVTALLQGDKLPLGYGKFRAHA